MKRVLALAAALTLSAGVCARAQTPAPSPERLALAQKLIQETGVADSSRQMLASFARSMPPVGDTAADQAKARARIDAAVAAQKDMIPRLLDAVARAYAENFTAQELNDLVAFYQAPTGRALVAKTPEIGQSVTMAVIRMMPDMIEDTERRYCAEVTCTAAERQKTAETVAKLRARIASGGPAGAQ